MEKISRILAPNARTKGYDTSRAQPARPGAPQMGRPETFNAVEDRMTLSEQLVEPILNGETLPMKSPEAYKPKESVKSQVVKEMTNKFFMKQSPKEVVRDSDQTHSEEVVSRSQSSSGSNVNPASSSDVNL